ncbi:demethylmenaquinone methyltransferase-like [Pecten maximus]|uniref:demethylmenaquinone methyltransferase-like n=1 Tax=Pecten maximus TaxID=6579 RepID=UPI0014584882|nr:demethylmenaquinone methyltransferase-like [Pecten maximus]
MLEREAARLSEIQPDHHVLEVGFGPGLGIEAACQYVKGGQGKIYGVDFSEEMVTMATKLVRQDVNDRKVKLILGDVADLSFFESNKFDRVFHCNTYYFWPDLDKAVRELHRVMKTDAIMVTTMNYERSIRMRDIGLFRYGDIDQRRYMNALEACGFRDVSLEKTKNKESGAAYDVMYAKKV